MKHAMLLFAILLLALPLNAQEAETLIGGDIESGGFGGPVLKFGPINGETGVLVGGRGGWIINHTFILGGGGYGLVSNVKARTADSVLGNRLMMGYGGLELEYVASSNQLVHLSIHALIGGGAVSYQTNNASMRNGSSDAFFIAEPGVSVNLNVTKFFRIAAGASYRYVAGLASKLSTNADLSGPTGVLTLKFGKF